MKKYIVYDVGGSFIKFALMDQEEIHMKGKVKTPHDSFESFLDTLEHAYQPFIGSVDGVAISMPGLVNSDSGYAVHGGSLKYIREMNVGEAIQNRLKLPVRIENDGKSAALGEVWKGGLREVQNGVAFVLGTGIGGGIVLNGELVKGAHLGAGEFSFIRMNGQAPIHSDNFLGHCGSTVNLVRSVAIALGKDPKEFSGEEMFRCIREGSEEAKEILQKYCELIATQLMNLQTILDPEVFVIGGGMSADPMLTEGLQNALDALQEKDFVSKVNGYQVKIVRSLLGNDANLYGALYQYLQSEGQGNIL
jgi:predicted NBD/HSP70 family sugar kinase